MKKILIIALNQAEKISGIEVYNSKLIDIFYELGYQIDEFSFIKSQDYLNRKITNRFHVIDLDKFMDKNWFYRNFLYRIILERKVNNLIKTTHYDLIINATNCAIKKIMWKKEYIWVQHFDSNFIMNSVYNKSIKSFFLKMFFRLFLFIFNLKTPLLHSKNVVTFFDGYIPNKWLSDKIKYFYIPICINSDMCDNETIISSNAIKKKYNSNIVYIGRIQQTQKNLNWIISNLKNVDYYGPIVDEEIAKKIGSNYKGVISTPESLINVFKNHSYLILSSFYEGFPTVFVEALSNATPIISSDDIKANKFFFNDYTNNIGFIIDTKLKKYDNFPWENISFLDYAQLCKNSYDFSQQKLNFQEFIELWRKIVNDILEGRK